MVVVECARAIRCGVASVLDGYRDEGRGREGGHSIPCAQHVLRRAEECARKYGLRKPTDPQQRHGGGGPSRVIAIVITTGSSFGARERARTAGRHATGPCGGGIVGFVAIQLHIGSLRVVAMK